MPAPAPTPSCSNDHRQEHSLRLRHLRSDRTHCPGPTSSGCVRCRSAPGRSAVIVVPEKTIGASFSDVPLSRFGFWTDWTVRPPYFDDAEGLATVRDRPQNVTGSAITSVTKALFEVYAPRTRGTRGSGLCPAHAGEPYSTQAGRLEGAVYPRARGGASRRHSRTFVRMGSIPAHAGEPRDPRIGEGLSPRTRGRNVLAGGGVYPRARGGAGDHGCTARCRVGSIPAHAGEPDLRDVKGPFRGCESTRVYPRARGGAALPRATLLVRSVYPRARGGASCLQMVAKMLVTRNRAEFPVLIRVWQEGLRRSPRSLSEARPGLRPRDARCGVPPNQDESTADKLHNARSILGDYLILAATLPQRLPDAAASRPRRLMIIANPSSCPSVQAPRWKGWAIARSCAVAHPGSRSRECARRASRQ